MHDFQIWIATLRVTLSTGLPTSKRGGNKLCRKRSTRLSARQGAVSFVTRCFPTIIWLRALGGAPLTRRIVLHNLALCALSQCSTLKTLTFSVYPGIGSRLAGKSCRILEPRPVLNERCFSKRAAAGGAMATRSFELSMYFVTWKSCECCGCHQPIDENTAGVDIATRRFHDVLKCTNDNCSCQNFYINMEDYQKWHDDDGSECERR